MAITKLNRYSLPTTLDLSAKTLTLPSASVTAHVTQTDLQPIKSDITALALREATNETSAAFNLPNQFIETFTDDTNLGTQTDGDRTSGYWGTVTSTNSEFGATSKMPNTGMSWTNQGGGGGSTSTSSSVADALMDNLTATGATLYMHMAGQTAYVPSITWTLDEAHTITKMRFHSDARGGTVARAKFSYSTDNVSFTVITSLTPTDGGSGGTSGIVDCTAGDGWIGAYWTGVSARYWKVSWDGYHTGDSDCGCSELEIWGDTVTGSATGTLIQSANTVASAKTVVGGTMLYKDNAGTATLGTDLKIYFSCNNGGAWTEAASYNAITPVYSTGIKQVRLGETTCTSGTGVIYKAVWANQAASSKETQLHGIGINY